MKLHIFQEANKLWQEFTKDAQNQKVNQFKVPKELLKLFHVGEFYYYVFDVKNSVFEMMSEEVEKVLGYDHKSIDVPFFLSRIHPDDQPYFLNFENKVTSFFSTLKPHQILNYKVSYDYRIKKSDGDYIRILQQVVTIQVDGKNVIRTFGIHTDISHLKPLGVPVLSFLGLNGEPSYLGVEVDNVFLTASVTLTRRETEIIHLLVKGKSSAQIAKDLFISKFTVDTHRRNLLRKTECGNTSSLIFMAIEKGWV